MLLNNKKNGKSITSFHFFSRNDKRLSLILLPLAYTINAPTSAKIA